MQELTVPMVRLAGRWALVAFAPVRTPEVVIRTLAREIVRLEGDPISGGA